jgi:hypothetical protein
VAREDGEEVDELTVQNFYASCVKVCMLYVSCFFSSENGLFLII